MSEPRAATPGGHASLRDLALPYTFGGLAPTEANCCKQDNVLITVGCT